MAFDPDHPETLACGQCGGAAYAADQCRIPGWLGVNWDDGLKTTYKCDDCGGRGARTDKDDGTSHREGICCAPRLEAH